jgi:adenylosuccinate lyase
VLFSAKSAACSSVKGMNREEAYEVVQSCAHQAWNQPQGDFHDLITKILVLLGYCLLTKLRLALIRSNI